MRGGSGLHRLISHCWLLHEWIDSRLHGFPSRSKIFYQRFIYKWRNFSVSEKWIAIERQELPPVKAVEAGSAIMSVFLVRRCQWKLVRITCEHWRLLQILTWTAPLLSNKQLLLTWRNLTIIEIGEPARVRHFKFWFISRGCTQRFDFLSWDRSKSKGLSNDFLLLNSFLFILVNTVIKLVKCNLLITL